jgi:hypothetical protein
LEKTWVNLRGPVPVFEGDIVMEAGETPKVDASNHLMISGELEMNRMNGGAVNDGVQPMTNGGHMINGMEGGALNDSQSLTSQTPEVEMDMS